MRAHVLDSFLKEVNVFLISAHGNLNTKIVGTRMCVAVVATGTKILCFRAEKKKNDVYLS